VIHEPNKKVKIAIKYMVLSSDERPNNLPTSIRWASW